MMNTTGIQWADYTFNPIVGCTNSCPYCYARQAAQRLSCPLCREYLPHFHPERLADLGRGKPGRVFMGSMADMFDPGVDPDWWREILLAHEDSGFRHRLMVLTKRPDQIKPILAQTYLPTKYESVLKTIWFGVTVTCQNDEWRIKHLQEVPAAGHFVSLEPILEPVDFSDWWGLYEYDEGKWATKVGSRWAGSPDWLVIGALSGSWLPPGWTKRELFRPAQSGWASQAIEQAQAAGVPVFVKTKPVKLPGVPVIQEWPAGLEA